MNAVQCKMARVALGISLREFANLANVGAFTISRLERGEKLRPSTIKRIQETFENAGLEFIPENKKAGVGVRLKQPQN